MIQVVYLWFVTMAWSAPPGPRDEAADEVPAPTDEAPDTTEAPSDAPAPTSPDSFGNVLQVAKQRYFGGELPYARELLLGLQERLRLGEEPALETAIEAMTYLGEVQYKLGDREGAEAAFRFIFERNPDAPISPYHHPIEVVALFDVVRAEVKASQQARIEEARALDPPELGPAPAWTFAPFGIAQLKQRRPGAAVVFGGLQVGFGVASVLLFQQVDRVNEPPADRNDDATFDAVTRRALQQKYLAQWPVTVGFYAVWGASIADAQRVWRSEQAKAVIGIGPVGARSHGVVLHGRF